MSSPTWAYGITTIKARRVDTLLRTLRSLKAAGFPEPRLFIDDDDDVHSWKKEFSLQCSIRYPRIHAWGNWILALYELYIREPHAGRYALFQDDIVAVKNLRQYLDAVSYPAKHYWNLITYPVNYVAIKDKSKTGWMLPGQTRWTGQGAQGLVFDRAAVIALLTSQLAINRPQHVNNVMKTQNRGRQNIDGGVHDALAKAGIREMIHNPSLIYHIGVVSAMGHKPQPAATSFPGETFDAMQLLKPTAVVPAKPVVRPVPPRPPQPAKAPAKAWMLGDHVANALNKVGITKERVEQWVGGDCGCKERQEKLNRLGLWARSLLTASTPAEQAKERLENMLAEGKK